MGNSSYYDDSAKSVENQTFGAYSHTSDWHIDHNLGDDFHTLDFVIANVSIFNYLWFHRPFVMDLASHSTCYLANSRAPPLFRMYFTSRIPRM